MMVALVMSSAAHGQMDRLKSLILMPGPVSAAHAKEEKNCNSCHAGFDKTGQDQRCLACHKDVAADTAAGKGFHGHLPKGRACRSCHTEHKGRNYDIVALDRDTFDHGRTDFHLTGAHASAACKSCHQEKNGQTKWRDAPGRCDSCHRNDSPHGDQITGNCDACHTTDNWRKTTGFDHSTTTFALLGKHATAPCASCHASQKYRFADTRCVACHRVADVHLGRFGEDCGRCHTEQGWKNARFDHSRTAFALTGAHRQTSCNACHNGSFGAHKLATDCATCHSDRDIHLGRNGKECGSCHTTTRWKSPNFDHVKASGFALRGAHADVPCEQCHQGALTDPLKTACASCHVGDSVHGSATMTSCGNCHNQSNWKSVAGFDHDLLAFPLAGMHATVPCESCHRDRQFAKTATACNDCHLDKDIHHGALGDSCGFCHNPNGWALWSFDHDRQTHFALTGAHSSLACAACHSKASPKPVARCGSCHAADDRHEGRFGQDCDRCHNTTDFGDVQWRR